jgi:AcrR family transcriptional regulator
METCIIQIVSIVLPLINFIMEARARILQKAHELFNRFGFRRVTMDEIALKTGMSKKTIYHSFSNKDEIVNAVVEDYIARTTRLCDKHTESAENAVHEVFLNIETIHELISELKPTAIEDLEKFFPAAFAKVYEHQNNYLHKKVKSNLQWGVKEELYRPEINIEIITRLRIETMLLPFDQQAFPYTTFNAVEVHKQFLEHYLYGLCTAEGQKLIKKYQNKK